MIDMTPETLPPNNKGQENIKGGPFLTDGSSALKSEPVSSDIPEEQARDAQIGEIKKSIVRPENVLPFTNNYSGVEAQKAPRNIGLVGNQGRETSGGDDGTGEKKKRMPKWLVRFIAGVSASLTLATGGTVLAKSGFFGGNGGNENEGTVPLSSVTTSGEMPSQSIDPVTPSAEVTVTPEVTPSPSLTEAPTPTIDQTEISAQKEQNFINKTGEYSYENIKDKLFNNGLKVGYKTYDLGVIDYYESDMGTQIIFQGWLFGYQEKNGNLILKVGFDSKDGKTGIIKDVVVPIDFYKKHSESGIGLSFWNYEFWREVDASTNFIGMKNDVGSIQNLLNNFVDKPMLFWFYSKAIDNSEMVDAFGEETSAGFNELINSNLSSVNQLLTEVSDNKKDIKIGNIDKVDSSNLILVGVSACFE